MENQSTEVIEVSQNNQVASVQDPLAPDQLKRQIELIQLHMKENMRDGEHYGKIPGCGEKPALLKAGAEKLAFIFRYVQKFEVKQTDYPKGHREYQTITTYFHNGVEIGQGLGSCSTLESKYRYRNAEKKCPACGKEAIIKGKAEFGGGWLCWGKKGGCNAKFPDGDKAIEGQTVGKIEHDNPADYYNTVLKMSKKRSSVDGALTCTAASDIFTQDIDEMPVAEGASQPMDANYNTKPKPESKPKEQAKPEVRESRPTPVHVRTKEDVIDLVDPELLGDMPYVYDGHQLSVVPEKKKKLDDFIAKVNQEYMAVFDEETSLIYSDRFLKRLEAQLIGNYREEMGGGFEEEEGF